jgi:hypothetical protein
MRATSFRVFASIADTEFVAALATYTVLPYVVIVTVRLRSEVLDSPAVLDRP